MPNRFHQRSCPHCNSDSAHSLFSLAPTQFLQSLSEGNLARYGDAKDEIFEIVRCSECAFVYTPLFPSDDFCKLLYDAEDDTTERPEEHPSLRPGWVAQQLRLASALLTAIAQEFGPIRPQVMDFGCGFGAVVRALNGPTAHCIGLETSNFMIRYLHAEQLPVISALSSSPTGLHGIVLSDVLEHMPQPRELLRELRRLLIPRGCLCVHVPNFDESRIRHISSDLKEGKRPPPELNPWEHLNYFSPRSLRQMLHDEGYEIVEVAVDIGLRPNLLGGARLGNVIKSALRLLKYTIDNQATTTLLIAKRDLQER